MALATSAFYAMSPADADLRALSAGRQPLDDEGGDADPQAAAGAPCKSDCRLERAHAAPANDARRVLDGSLSVFRLNKCGFDLSALRRRNGDTLHLRPAHIRLRGAVAEASARCVQALTHVNACL